MASLRSLDRAGRRSSGPNGTAQSATVRDVTAEVTVGNT